jgi:hypothetical protein
VAFSAGWGFGSSLILIFHTSFHNIIAVVWSLGLSIFVYFIHPFGGYDCAFPASCLYCLIICFCYMFITTAFNIRTFVHFERAWLAGQGRPICKSKHLYVHFYTMIRAIATLAKLISMYSGCTTYCLPLPSCSVLFRPVPPWLFVSCLPSVSASKYLSYFFQHITWRSSRQASHVIVAVNENSNSNVFRDFFHRFFYLLAKEVAGRCMT